MRRVILKNYQKKYAPLRIYLPPHQSPKHTDEKLILFDILITESNVKQINQLQIDQENIRSQVMGLFFFQVK